MKNAKGAGRLLSFCPIFDMTHDELDQLLQPFEPLLGRWSDARIATAAGVSIHAVAGRRRRLGIGSHLQAYDSILGLFTDEHVAHLAGVAKQTITVRRSSLGIPSHRDQQTNPLEVFDPLLGVLSDSAIAQLAGRSPSAVLKRRRKLGIITYRPRSDTPEQKKTPHRAGHVGKLASTTKKGLAAKD